MDIEKALMQGKAYGMAKAITDNYIPLRLPVVFKVSKSKKFAKACSGFYTLCENISKAGFVEYHCITLSYSHNLQDAELFDSVAHELLHASQAEKNSKREVLPHNDKFWAQHDAIMTAYGLTPNSEQFKAACKATDRGI